MRAGCCRTVRLAAIGGDVELVVSLACRGECGDIGGLRVRQVGSGSGGAARAGARAARAGIGGRDAGGIHGAGMAAAQEPESVVSVEILVDRVDSGGRGYVVLGAPFIAIPRSRRSKGRAADAAGDQEMTRTPARWIGRAAKPGENVLRSALLSSGSGFQSEFQSHPTQAM